MLVFKNGSEVQITLASDPNDETGGEIQALLRALRDRQHKCEMARGVRMGRYVPSHSQTVADLPVLLELAAALKEQGIEEIPINDY